MVEEAANTAVQWPHTSRRPAATPCANVPSRVSRPGCCATTGLRPGSNRQLPEAMPSCNKEGFGMAVKATHTERDRRVQPGGVGCLPRWKDGYRHRNAVTSRHARLTHQCRRDRLDNGRQARRLSPTNSFFCRSGFLPGEHFFVLSTAWAMSMESLTPLAPASDVAAGWPAFSTMSEASRRHYRNVPTASTASLGLKLIGVSYSLVIGSRPRAPQASGISAPERTGVRTAIAIPSSPSHVLPVR